MKLKMLGDRIAVRRLTAEQVRTAGSTIIIVANGDPPAEGIVVAAGPGRWIDGAVGRPTRPMQIKVGDRILFGAYTGQRITVEGEEFLVMREDDVLGVTQGANE